MNNFKKGTVAILTEKWSIAGDGTRMVAAELMTPAICASAFLGDPLTNNLNNEIGAASVS